MRKRQPDGLRLSRKTPSSFVRQMAEPYHTTKSSGSRRVRSTQRGQAVAKLPRACVRIAVAIAWSRAGSLARQRRPALRRSATSLVQRQPTTAPGRGADKLVQNGDPPGGCGGMPYPLRQDPRLGSPAHRGRRPAWLEATTSRKEPCSFHGDPSRRSRRSASKVNMESAPASEFGSLIVSSAELLSAGRYVV